MEVCSYLVKVRLWMHHPVKGKIKEILPVNFSLGDMIPSWTLAPVWPSPLNCLIHLLHVAKDGKFPLLSKLQQLL